MNENEYNQKLAAGRIKQVDSAVPLITPETPLKFPKKTLERLPVSAEKATPADNDLFAIFNSATGLFQKISWASIKAALFAQEAWHTVGAGGEPAFENSWTGSLGSPWANVGFMKDTLGFVHLRGLAQNGTVSAYPGVPMFTLPVGYRPATGHLSNVQANGALGRVDILTDGKVNAIQPTANNWVALDGIIFKAA